MDAFICMVPKAGFDLGPLQNLHTDARGTPFTSEKRDYVYQACLDTLEAVRRQVSAWIDDYNREAPHSALNIRSPVEFYAAWLVKNKT